MKELPRDHLSQGTKEDVFEQMKSFAISEQYAEVRSLVNLLVEKTGIYVKQTSVFLTINFPLEIYQFLAVL